MPSFVDQGGWIGDCPVRDRWEAWWGKITLPLAGKDLEQAQATLAVYTDPEDEQGEDGDCGYCVAQVERLAPLVEQGEALARAGP
jgi:hypothetical protein